MCKELGLNPAKITGRKRKIPKRLDEGGDGYEHKTLEEYFRVEFFAVIDAANIHLLHYFDSPDLKRYHRLTGMLFTGVVDDEIVGEYPELQSRFLKSELEIYCNKYPSASLSEHLTTFQNLSTDMKVMFPSVETLLRLALISPASSCTAERSLSALRRLKTWLRTSMTQERLNHTAVCHIHRDMMEEITDEYIAKLFVSGNEERCRVFGSFD